MYKDGNGWKDVTNPSPYGTGIDMYNKVTFDPVTTTELKLVVQLRRPPAENNADVTRNGFSGGVIEWKIN
jgi:hypothetical protein